MESYDEQTINAELDVLYEKIKDNSQIMAILSEEKKNNHLTNMPDSQSLFLLFSWESLHRVADLMTSSA
jgi:FMN phosphatase YigB (HAD superfamily)